jgi:16S rRNA (guanine527-N7)-methyltransferase
MADARAAREELERLLATEVPPAIVAALAPGVADALERYIALLLEANVHLNLTRVVEPRAVARLHLLDALSALPLIAEAGPRQALDLGSGGGVPGIVLAIAAPDVQWTLIDSVGKKASALAGFVEGLGLPNVEVRAARAEDLGRGPQRASFDVVTARACAPMPVLLEYAMPLLRLRGRLIAWKGALSASELGAGVKAVELLGGSGPVVRPAGMAALGDHVLVIVEKERPTPDRYPRRPGEPTRRPLGRPPS